MAFALQMSAFDPKRTYLAVSRLRRRKWNWEFGSRFVSIGRRCAWITVPVGYETSSPGEHIGGHRIWPGPLSLKYHRQTEG